MAFINIAIAEILTVLFFGSELVLEEVGGANFLGFIFLWVREDEIFVNFALGNRKYLSQVA